MASMLLCLGALQNCQVQCRCQVDGRIFYFCTQAIPSSGSACERGVLGSVRGGQNGRNQKDSGRGQKNGRQYQEQAERAGQAVHEQTERLRQEFQRAAQTGFETVSRSLSEAQ